MEFDVEIRKLSPAFMAAYPAAQYPELLYKADRPYTCLLIDTHADYLICLPFRSDIRHKNAFLFHQTARSKRTPSGIDYKKAVVIKKEAYLDTAPAMVDSDEYSEAMANIQQIVSEATAYVDAYIAHVNGTKPLHPREFSRKYVFSTLPYFHDILGLPVSEKGTT